MDQQGFPEGFTWGAATASYQIEGAVREDGRGESIWDRFSHTAGKVKNGDTGDIACDHYHRWQDDIEIMRELNLQAYRFSVAWPRIVPEGWGKVNKAGLDFYDRLVDGLLTAGIEPWVTLYHWDLPTRLDDQGGWTSRDTAKAFAEYADVVSSHLGDRVSNWITVNEPWVSAVLGYGWGIHAPGHENWSEVAAAAHHLLLAHGMAVPAIRSHVEDSTVGITLNPAPVYPATDLARDADAAVREDGLRNRLWLDPLAGRGYPADVVELLGDAMPDVETSDLDIIAVPTDFLGVNYYTPDYVVEDTNAFPTRARGVALPNKPRTDLGWVIEPDAFTDLLVRLENDYHLGPLYVTENGAAYDDKPPVNGVVADAKRTDYYQGHLEAILAAREQGAPVEGYFAWSLLDNFEWAEGYTKRFGIVYVDYPTQQRTIKDSGRWYARVIERNGLDTGS